MFPATRILGVGNDLGGGCTSFTIGRKLVRQQARVRNIDLRIALRVRSKYVLSGISRVGCKERALRKTTL